MMEQSLIPLTPALPLTAQRTVMALFGALRGFVLLHVLFEFGFGLGEGELPAVGAGHVEEVLAFGRVRRRVDRRDAGVGDRPRRQPGVHARVVRRVRFQLRLGQRLCVVVDGEAGGRVAAQRHPFAQPVVDHLGHLFALARQARLVFDDRGDRDHVVHGQVLRLRVLHVHALDLLLEVGELQLDQFLDRPVPFQFPGVGEEEAFEVLRLLAAVFRGIQVLRLLRRVHVAPRRPSSFASWAICVRRYPSGIVTVTVVGLEVEAFGSVVSASIASP